VGKQGQEGDLCRQDKPTFFNSSRRGRIVHININYKLFYILATENMPNGQQKGRIKTSSPISFQGVEVIQKYPS